LSEPQAFALVDYHESGAVGDRIFTGRVACDGTERSISGRGNGLISSILAALRDDMGIDLEVVDYNEHAIGQGTDVNAAAYVECKTPDGKIIFGCGMDADVATASVRAVLSAANAVAGRPE
jgi:2-isopropylmalate synthase